MRGSPPPCLPLPHHDVTPKLRSGGAGGSWSLPALQPVLNLAVGLHRGVWEKGSLVGLGSCRGAGLRLGATAPILWAWATGVTGPGGGDGTS